MHKFLTFFLFALGLSVFCTPAAAQSETAVKYAKAAAQYCPQNWTSQNCLKTLSRSAFEMISGYGAHLKNQNKPKAAEYLKEQCAASTAGTKEDNIPAYAYHSAFTVCLNAIAEIHKQLGTAPDDSLYQLLAFSTLCLREQQDKTCTSFEAQLTQNYGR
jgi:hypothetical protein